MRHDLLLLAYTTASIWCKLLVSLNFLTIDNFKHDILNAQSYFSKLETKSNCSLLPIIAETTIK